MRWSDLFERVNLATRGVAEMVDGTPTIAIVDYKKWPHVSRVLVHPLCKVTLLLFLSHTLEFKHDGKTWFGQWYITICDAVEVSKLPAHWGLPSNLKLLYDKILQTRNLYLNPALNW